MGGVAAVEIENAPVPVKLEKTPETAIKKHEKEKHPTMPINTKKCGTNIMKFLQKFEKKDEQDRTKMSETNPTSKVNINKTTEPTEKTENKKTMGTNQSAKKEPNKRKGDRGTKTSGTTKVKGRPLKVMQLDDNPTTLKDFLELKMKAREAKSQEIPELMHNKTTLSNPAAVLEKFMDDDRGDKNLGESSAN